MQHILTSSVRHTQCTHTRGPLGIGINVEEHDDTLQLVINIINQGVLTIGCIMLSKEIAARDGCK